MQGRIVFLLEEPSMKVLLDELLPRLFAGWQSGQQFLCIPHEGKSDLDRSIPRKLVSWRIPDDRFVVVRDNDGADCVEIKARLRTLCERAGRPETLVRLVCQELESWYRGDFQALAAAFGMRTISAAQKKRYAHPDRWRKPSGELKRLVPAFQKIGGARTMAAHPVPERNLSRSFQVFVEGVRRVANEMGYHYRTGPN